MFGAAGVAGGGEAGKSSVAGGAVLLCRSVETGHSIASKHNCSSFDVCRESVGGEQHEAVEAGGKVKENQSAQKLKEGLQKMEVREPLRKADPSAPSITRRDMLNCQIAEWYSQTQTSIQPNRNSSSAIAK